jgi:membrane protein YfhO
MVFLFFLAGSLLLAALVRAWVPGLSRRAAVAYLLATAAFFAAPLSTATSQASTDIAYQWRPWAEQVDGRVAPLNPLLSDVPLQMLPFHALVRARLLRGIPPLWAHELGTGQPLLGNAQSAPFAPLHLLALPLPPLFGLPVAIAWQVLLALLLTHGLLLALGAGESGAAFGAVAYAFSAYSIVWAYHPLGMAAAWVPGVLLGLVLLRRDERGGLTGLVACGTGLALSGHPETLAFAAFASATLVGGLLLARRSGRLRFLARTLGAAALTACFAAPALLPVLEQLPASARLAAVAANPEGFAPLRFERRFLWPLLDPLVFGSPRDGDWVGPANFNEMCSAYAGLSALALALAGAWMGRGRALAVLGGGLAALLAALRIAPFYAAVRALPGLGYGAHGRLRLLWVLAVAIAAGLELERLPATRSGRIAAAVPLAVAGLGLLALPPQGAPWQRAWWVATLVGTGLALLALASRRLAPWFPPLAVAALAVDLLLLGFRYQPAVPRRFDLAPPPALSYLMAENGRSPVPFRVIAESRDLAPSLPSLYGLWDPRSNDPMQPAATALVIGHQLALDYDVGEAPLLTVRPFPTAFLDFLGVRFLLARHRRNLPPPWEPVIDLQGGRIWRNPDALPLFFLPASAERVSTDVETLLRVSSMEDFGAMVVAQGRTAGSMPQRGAVTLDRVEPNGFALTVFSPTGGLVASSVSDAPGWRLAVDGRPAPVERVNGAFLGFTVAPGRHRVRLVYRPAGWVWGLALCAGGVLAALGWGLYDRWLELRHSGR